VRRLALLTCLLCLSCGGASYVEPEPDYYSFEEPDLGWIIVHNESDTCYECLDMLMDGELRVSHCQGPAFCPGTQADGLYENGHVYEITFWSRTSDAVWTSPPFLLDGEEVLVIP